MMHRPLAPKKGFTLVETMVAITVLAVALVGPFTAVQSALTASYVARDELTASSLAQEGMEYIRSIRDNNYVNGRTWLDELSTYTNCYGVSPGGYCVVDPSQGDIHTDFASTPAMVGYGSASVPPLYVTSGGIYNQQASGTATRFTRTVRILVVSTGPVVDEVKVIVTVSWTSAHQTYSVVVTDNLRDWL